MMQLTIFEIDNPNAGEFEEIKLTSKIPPSMSDTLLQLNITTKNMNHIKF